MSDELTPFDEWANTPHAQLGFSPRQLQAQEVLAALQALTLERDGLREALTEWQERLAYWEMERARPAEAALDAIRRETERASDVRVNRTKLIGNVNMIAQRALSGARVEGGGERQ